MKRIKIILVLTALLTNGCNSLWDNWHDQPTWTKDNEFDDPSKIDFDTESQIVYFKGKYFLYHRILSGRHFWKLEIGYSDSTDGDVFTYRGVAIHKNDGGVGCASVYAPKVLVEPNLLTMVYEAQPKDPSQGCNPPDGSNQYVAIAHSTDGVHWTDHRVLIKSKQPWEGKVGATFTGNVGTPTLTKAPDGYWIGYHGFDGVYLKRGVAHAAVSDARSINSSNLTRHANPMEFEMENGGPLPASIYGVGVGAADITRWQAGSGGKDDGGYYMVFEGFAGSAICNANVKVTIAFARAEAPQGPWVVQDQVFLGQRNACGRGGPSWWYDTAEKRYKVVLSTNDARSLQRLRLANAYAK